MNVRPLLTACLAALVTALAVIGAAGCDGGFALGGQVITVKVYQNSPNDPAPIPDGAPVIDRKPGNYSVVRIDNADGGTSFMGPSEARQPTTRPSE